MRGRTMAGAVRGWPLAPALAALLLAAPAGADGIPAYYDRGAWHLLSESSQHAFVSLRDGTETLVLQVAAGQDGALAGAQRLAWITPVPAPPEVVRVDVTRTFPEMHGVRPLAALTSNVGGILALLSLSQIYPFFPVALAVSVRSRSEGEAQVHQIVRRDGVEVELLSAASTEALARHLEQREVPLPASALASLGSYARPGASFVLYRVADLGEYRRALEAALAWPPSMGVEVTFPSEEGFFPLVASAALPGEPIDIVVTALGHVVASPGAPAGLSTEHFLGRSSASLGIAPQVPYTRFRLYAAPSALTADLRFRPGAPESTRVATAILQRADLGSWLLALGAILLAAISASSGLLARAAWRGERRPTRGEAALLGLGNLFTVIGVRVLSGRTAEKLGAPPGTATRFTAVFSVVFCATLLALWLLLKIAGE